MEYSYIYFSIAILGLILTNLLRLLSKNVIRGGEDSGK